jgi:hypothetical protein
MTDIVNLNGGADKTTPADTDSLPIQQTDGLTLPITVGNLLAGVRSSITSLTSTIATYVPLSQKGAANGVATLDSTGKIPTGQIPSGIGGGSGSTLPAWTSVSGGGNYTVGSTGGRFSVNAASGATNLVLPASPTADTEVWYQIEELGANAVYLSPSGSDTLLGSSSLYRGKHDPSAPRTGLEILRYRSGKWFAAFGRVLPDLLPSADPLDALKLFDLSVEGGTIVDLKSNTTISPSGSPTISTTVYRSGSKSLVLNGSQQLDLTVPGANFGTAPFTFAVGFRFAAVGSTNNYLTPNLQYPWDCGGGNTQSVNWYGANNTLAIVNGGANQVAYTATPATGTWYDVAMIKYGTKYLLTLANQIVGASNTAPSSVDLSGTNTIRVGRDKVSGNAGFNGYFDYFRIYAAAKGDSLTHAYTQRFFADYEGSATSQGGATPTATGTIAYSSAAYRSGSQSLSLGGSSYLTYPSIAAYDLGSGGFEIAGWFKASTSQNSPSAIVSGGATTGTFDAQSWSVHNNFSTQAGASKATENKLSFWCGAVSSANAILTSDTSINDNQPHYFRVIKYPISGGAVTVLVLDNKIEDIYIGAYTVSATTRGLVVGSQLVASGRSFTGLLDAPSIWTA